MLGLPSLVIVLADNQKDLAEASSNWHRLEPRARTGRYAAPALADACVGYWSTPQHEPRWPVRDLSWLTDMGQAASSRSYSLAPSASGVFSPRTAT